MLFVDLICNDMLLKLFVLKEDFIILNGIYILFKLKESKFVFFFSMLIILIGCLLI